MTDVRNSVPALALSLIDDPFYQAITPEHVNSRESQLAVLHRYFEYSLLEAQRIGRCVFAPDASLGAAAWLLPQLAEVAARESAAKKAAMAEILGPAGSRNYHAIVDFMSPLAERLLPEKAWYLSIVGIHPTAQGRGLGQVLLKETLNEASSRRKVCYLETFSERNIVFYSRLGFSSVARYSESVTGSAYVVMRRDA